MALQFPTAPTDGQLYSSGINVWQYNATVGRWDVKILSPVDPGVTVDVISNSGR